MDQARESKEKHGSQQAAAKHNQLALLDAGLAVAAFSCRMARGLLRIRAVFSQCRLRRKRRLRTRRFH